MVNAGNKNVVCFGEILWDMLPTGKQPGGAPMNVAYHLSRLGIDCTLISRVGCDMQGDELLAFLHDRGIPTKFVQKDSMYPTSEVLVNVEENEEVNYDIVAPRAWDFIKYDDCFADVAGTADALVYGSLVARNTASRGTLLRLLDKANYRLFDVNLRSPHYTREAVDMLLQRADAIKVNIHELIEISSWFDNRPGSEFDGVATLQDRYALQEIIVTKGASGASYYTPLARYHYPAVRVEINDTVGSGDAFLAAFLAQKLKGEAGEHMLALATALGAYVTTQTGACPTYTKEDLNRFIQRNAGNNSIGMVR